MSLRERFIQWAHDRLGHTVLWAAKGPLEFDCSGLVTCDLLHLGGPDWRQTHNTDRLWAELDPVAGEPQPGDLVFWWAPGAEAPAKGDVEHVAILLAGGLVLTADGATSKIHTVEEAKEANAVVRLRKDVNYRPRLAGFRRFPLIEGADGSVGLGCAP